MPNTPIHSSRARIAQNRRDEISNRVAARVDGNVGSSTDDDFTRHLSGGSHGPYGGLKLLHPNGRHENNGDEAKYPKFNGSFSKGLQHDPKTGLVAKIADFEKFVSALAEVAESDPTVSFPGPSVAPLEIIEKLKPLYSISKRKLVNPVSGASTVVSGIDPLSAAIPPAPELSSRVAATEMVELYWMAILRDVRFSDFSNHKDFKSAVAELNTLNKATASSKSTKPFAQHYIGSKLSTKIDASTAFRGSAPGNNVGEYLSQFLIQDVPFGTLDFEQKQLQLKTKGNYLDTRDSWFDVQNGSNPKHGRGDLETPASDTPRRHITTFRDLAHYVHYDALHESYFNAALILMGGNAAVSKRNPYNGLKVQEGFGTFGGPHMLVAVTEVAQRALKAIWHQKWLCHRRLRPEAMGARVEYKQSKDIHSALLKSTALKVAKKTFKTCLLPMAFPEGSPMHPSYGAGHATVAGACTTILKAFFDTNAPLPKKFKVNERKDGGTKLSEISNSRPTLTVGGEINKLAANISIGRNGAGVHYRTDYTASMALGEAVATAMLQEQAMSLREGRAGNEIAWEFENFDGNLVQIYFDGSIRSDKASSVKITSTGKAQSYSCIS